MAKAWEGVHVLAITPLNEDYTLNEDNIRKEVEWVVEQGCHGIWPMGYLGEGNVLDEDVVKRALKVFRDAAGDRLLTGAGCCGINPFHIIRLVNHAEELGYDMAWVPPLCPRRPSDDELFEFYEFIHDRTSIPLGIYSTWAFNVYFRPSVLARIADLPRMVCMKEVITDWDHIAGMYNYGVFEKLKVFTTHAQVPMFMLGAAGNICSPHVVPRMIEMWNEWKSGNVQRAIEINAEAHGFLLANPAIAQTAFGAKITESTEGFSKAVGSAVMGVEMGPPMLPYRAPGEEQLKLIRQSAASSEQVQFLPETER